MSRSTAFRGNSRRTESEDGEENIDTNTLNSTTMAVPERPIHRGKKRRRLEVEAKPSVEGLPMSLSNDVLYQVLGFLICSKSRKVDGDALRCAMLVCKQWNSIATSKSVWAVPEEKEDGDGDGHRMDPIGDSLLLEEITTGSLPESDSDGKLSLIGFAKRKRLKILGDNSLPLPSMVLATARATDQNCVLVIEKKGTKCKTMINQLFEAHFFQGTKGFLRAEGKNVFMQESYPRGVIFRDGRVIRWYGDEGDISCPPSPVFAKNLQGYRCGFADYESTELTELGSGNFQQRLELCCSLAHLRRLEEEASEETNTSPGYRVSLEITALLVDWIVEIMHCFDLEERIIFHAMSLFRGFASSFPLSINIMQLALSACMLIASKCNLACLKPTDLTLSSDNCFSKTELMNMEELIIESRRWRLAVPTVLDFVYAYAKEWDIAEDCREIMLMRYISELALQSQIYIEKNASLSAASVIATARFALQEGKPLWNDRLEQITGITFGKLCSCTVELSSCLEEVRMRFPNLRMITRRFQKVEWGNVANTSIPTISSSAVLVAYQARATRNDSERGSTT